MKMISVPWISLRQMVRIRLALTSLQKEKLSNNRANKLAVVYVVRYNKNMAAYFTVSMSSINVEHLDRKEKVEHATPIRYPAMLLGQVVVDKKHRGKGIGADICNSCMGRPQEVVESRRYRRTNSPEDAGGMYGQRTAHGCGGGKLAAGAG